MAIIRQDFGSIGGGTKTSFYHTVNGTANSYVDCTVEKATDEWYLLFNLAIVANYDSWRKVYINGTSIGNISNLSSDAVQIGNMNGNYGCLLVKMTTHLNAGDVVRIEEINSIAGIGLILCNQ